MEKQTIGKQFQTELENSLYDNNIIKPWQLRNAEIVPIYLSCTLDDLKTYWNQDARFREGFDIIKEDNIVSLPNFFVKIDGVYEDEKKYDELLEFLTKNSYTELFYERDIEDWDYKFRHLIQDKIVRNKIEKIIKKENFTLDDLKEYANENFINLNSYISSYIIDSLNQFVKKQNDKHCNLVDVVLSTLNINQELFKQFENWDFGFQVPKVVIINSTERSLNSSYMDFIAFLNFIGVDIVYVSTRGEKIDKSSFNKITTFVLDKFKKPKTRWEVEQEIEKQKTKKFLMFAIPIVTIIIMLIGIYFYNTKYTVYQLKESYNIGTIITTDMLIETEINKFTFEDEMIQDKKQIVGKILIYNLNKDDIIQENFIIDNKVTLIDYTEKDNEDYRHDGAINKQDGFIFEVFNDITISEDTQIVIKNHNDNSYLVYHFYENDTLIYSSEEINCRYTKNILTNKNDKFYDLFQLGNKNFTIKIDLLNDNYELLHTEVIENVKFTFVENMVEGETNNTENLSDISNRVSNLLPLLKTVCLMGTIISVVSFVFSFASYDDRKRGSSIMMLLIFSTMLLISTFILPKLI